MNIAYSTENVCGGNISATAVRSWWIRDISEVKPAVWTTTPRGTVNQELKLYITHLILSWLR